MEKSLSIFLVAVVFSFFLVSCPSSVNPASKGSATVNISFSIPEVMAPDARAVLGSEGYLFVRTTGGPDGDYSPLYGPYPLSGGSVTIPGIPEGTYSNMCFLHSTADLTGSTVTLQGEELTIDEALSLPDSEFVSRVLGAGDDEGFSALINGYGSAGETGAITINPGPNEVSVTLSPMCSTDSTVYMTLSGAMYYGNYSNEGNRFIRFELSPFPETWSSLLFNVSTIDPDAPFALYSESGSLLSGFAFDTDMNAFTLNTPVSALPLYLYLGENSGTIPFFAALETQDLVHPRLQTLTVNGSAVTPVISDSVFTYSIGVQNTVDTAVLAGAPSNPSHTIVYNPGSTVTLQPAGNTTPVTLTITDPVTSASQAYTVNVIRDADPSINGIPSALSFTIIGSDTQATQYLTVGNNGTGPLRLTCTIPGADPSYFSILPHEATIPYGDYEVFTLVYANVTAYETRSATLTITHNDPNYSDFVIDLTGSYTS